MKPPKVSLVIPVYNESQYLPRCLKAAFDQDIPLHEIIVVDNNSSDGSVAKAQKQFSDAVFITEPKQGIVFARNAGFAAASGDIIAKIDADTILDPQWHTNLLETIGEADGWTGYVSNNELNEYIQPVVNVVFRFITYRLNRFIAGAPVMFGSNMAVRKAAWHEIINDLHMRNDIWEDLDVSLALHALGRKIVISQFQGGSISARSGNAPFMQFYRRAYGEARVFLLWHKHFSYVLALLFMQTNIVVWLILKPLSTVGRTIATRPRPEQY